MKKPIYYTIKDGDDLWIIARKYGVTIGEIIKLNNLEKIRKFSKGDRIRVI